MPPKQADPSKLLFKASQEGNLAEVARLAAEPGVDLNRYDDYTGFTALVAACSEGRAEVVRFLLQVPRIQVNFPSRSGSSPLLAACYKRQTEIVKILLEDPRVDVNQRGAQDGQSPFGIACRSGLEDVVLMFLLLGDRVDVDQCNAQGESPFWMACNAEKGSVVKLLLCHESINVNRAPPNRESPIIYACLYDRHETVQLLLNDPRVDVNCQSQEGETPLAIACREGNLHMIEILLGSGRRIDTRRPTHLGETPMSLAIERSTVGGEIVHLLLEYETDAMQVVRNLRTRLGQASLESEIFGLTIFLCDSFLRIADPGEVSVDNRQGRRFFEMIQRLPMEMQMVLINRCLGSHRNLITFLNREAGFKLIATLFMHKDPTTSA